MRMVAGSQYWMLMRLANVAVNLLPDRSLACPDTPAETTHFQFDRYQAVEPVMKEEQVEREILSAYLQWNFGADKAKFAAHFDKELPKAIEAGQGYCHG